MSNFNRFVTLALILVIIGGLAFVGINYNARINSMSEKLDNRQQKIDGLTEETTALKEKVNELETINSEQKSKIEKLSEGAASGYQQLESDVNEIQEKVANFTNKFDLQQKAINGLAEENIDIKKSINQVETANTKQTSRVEDVENAISTLNSELNGKVEKLSATIASGDEKLEAELAESNEQVDELADKLEAQQKAINGLAEENIAIKKEVNTIDQLQAENSKLKKDVHFQQKAIDGLLEENISIKNEIAKVNSVNNDQQSRIDELKKLATSLGGELQKKIEKLSEEVASGDQQLQSKLAAIDEEVTTLADKVSSFEEELGSLSEENNELGGRLESGLSELRDNYLTVDEFEKLKQAVDTQEETIFILQKEVNELSSEVETIQTGSQTAE